MLVGCEVSAAADAFGTLMWLPLSTLSQTLPVGVGKKATVPVCIDDVLLFPRLTQAVAQLKVALTWKMEPAGVGQSEQVLSEAPAVLNAKQALAGLCDAMKKNGVSLEATRHLAASVNAQIVERCQKYVSMVSKFIHGLCAAWLEQRNGLPDGMGEMCALSIEELHDAKVHAQLAKLVERDEVVNLYNGYKALKTGMAEASRIFQCFQIEESCLDDCCSKELPEWEVEATTFVDCLVVAQVIWSGEKQSMDQRLPRLTKAQTVTERLPASWAAVLQEEIDGIGGTPGTEDGGVLSTVGA